MSIIDNFVTYQAGVPAFLTNLSNGAGLGWQVREYLLERWQRTSAYGDAKSAPLHIEQVLAKTHEGTDRMANLAVACEPCNAKQGKLPVEVFLKDRLARLQRIKE